MEIEKRVGKRVSIFNDKQEAIFTLTSAEGINTLQVYARELKGDDKSWAAFRL